MKEQLEDIKQSKIQIGGAGAVDSLEESTKLLWEPALEKDRYTYTLPATLAEEEAIEAAEKRIRESGLLYDRRVLRAFHTALKCSEESPLLVLAGISGTGKSALPTRYAEAMGMHFLNVPIQPGWDSPADLLGFYNHLEGRFRPTELTRALLQMDYVHEPAHQGADASGSDLWPYTAAARVDLSERMLLVLLDEMNLARVEYYFSEFLSRLELRRGVDPFQDRGARQLAELLLDLGSASGGQRQTLSTYVGQNVLFVGTMNEDESTQTLSDKVVDRSNVMRFGRPANLVLGVEERSRQYAPGHLRRETWQRWIDSPSRLAPEDRRRLDEWIARVNENLSRVGKPFAYRVAKAIGTYVQQYPDRSEQGLRDAFADQVELRVLPRMRGIDTHESAAISAIDGVTSLVASELGDEKLASALRQARDASGDLFQWHGVDRLEEIAAMRD